MKSLSARLDKVGSWKLSRRKTLLFLIIVWLIVTFMTYFGFLHVQHEHAQPEKLANPLKKHAIMDRNKRNDILNYKSHGLLTFALMIRSTILVDPVSQFYQSVFPSLLAFWNENLSKDLTIVLDEDRYYTTYWMDDDARMTLKPILNVIFKKESLPKYWNKLYLTGYDRQQYSTLQLDLYTDKDIIIMLDTDSPFIVMPMRSDFIDDTTNKIKLVASNIYGGPNRQHDWSTSCKLLFGKFIIDGMTQLPQVYHKSTLINFRNYFTEIMRREYNKFVIKYIENNPDYPGIGNDIQFDIDSTHPLNNTEMNRTILFALNDPASNKWSFNDAFMFFAQNFTNKPYSEYTLLMNYAYQFEHDKYEWHIDNWNIKNENKPHHRISGHWKYAKPLTHHYARVTCCHLYFYDQSLDIVNVDNQQIYDFCDSVRDDYPDLNNFMEDWFINGPNRMSISPQFSDNCDNDSCQTGTRFERDDEKTKERYKKMREMINAKNNFFSNNSLEIKYRNCWNITKLELNKVYHDIRMRHKGKHGQLPHPSFHHRNTFKEISGGKY